MAAEIDDRLTTGKEITLFETYPFTVEAGCTRNADFWGATVDFSCLGVLNSDYADYPGYKGGVAISARHVLQAGHCPFIVGNELTFATMESAPTLYTRTVTDVTVHPSYENYYPDIAIATLSEDLPASIVPAKMLPDNWEDWFPELPGVPSDVARWGHGVEHTRLYRLPIAIHNMSGRVHVENVLSVGASYSVPSRLHTLEGTTPESLFYSVVMPQDVNRQAFSYYLVKGDCGHGGFLILNGAPVLAHMPITSPSYVGTFTVGFADWINSVMAEDGEYQLERADLSGFVKA